MVSLDVSDYLKEDLVRVKERNGPLHYISEKSNSSVWMFPGTKWELIFYFFVRKLSFILIPNSLFGTSKGTFN